MWARRRAKPISLADLGQSDNAAQGRSDPVMARRAGHCVVARSSQIRKGYARRSRLALPGTARPPFLESIFESQSSPLTPSGSASLHVIEGSRQNDEGRSSTPARLIDSASVLFRALNSSETE